MSGIKKDINKTGSLNVPIALCGSDNQKVDWSESPKRLVFDLFLINSLKS